MKIGNLLAGVLSKAKGVAACMNTTISEPIVLKVLVNDDHFKSDLRRILPMKKVAELIDEEIKANGSSFNYDKKLETLMKAAEKVSVAADFGSVEVSHLAIASFVEGGLLSKLNWSNKQKNDLISVISAIEFAYYGMQPQLVDVDFDGIESEGELEEQGEQQPYYRDMLTEFDDKPFIGREIELDSLLVCLERRDKPNAILIGEPGVGKTDIVRGLAKRMVEDCPAFLAGKKLYELDIPAMLAGSTFRGQFEDRLKKTIEQMCKEDRPVVFIDEIHTVIGCGTTTGGNSMDAANILKPYLTSGKIRVIGATTNAEYKKFVESDPAFMRRFQTIAVNEPTPNEAIEMLKTSKSAYEEFHGVKIPNNVVETAVNSSVRYLHDRFLPDKAIDIIDQTAARVKIHGNKKLTVADVDDTISILCKIPKKELEEDELEKVRNIDKTLAEQVFGQEEAIQKVSDAIRTAKAGLNDPDKPLGTFVFVGPSGVGKTEVAKQLAQKLNIGFVRFDMSEYAEPHTVAKLIGSPAGYVGYEDGGLLVEEIRKTPHCVLLLDEIEKAHPDVYKTFLQVFDYGILTDSKGRKADFRNVIIIMTSNAGNSERVKSVGFNNQMQTRSEVSVEAIKQIMPPELIGRLTDIIQFNPLSAKVAELIVDKEMRSLFSLLKGKGIKATCEPSAKKEIVNRGLSDAYGARAIQRIIGGEIKKLFVKEIFDKTEKQESVTLSYENEFTLERS